MPKHEEIINELEEKRVGFANNEYKTPSFHFSERWKLLLSDESSSSRLSSGRRSILLRARGLATDIVRKLGCEVLLLVLSTLDRQKLAILDKRTFVVALGDWWRAVPHPEALAIVASKCFAEHGLNRAIPSARQSLANTSSTEQDPAAAFETAIWLAAQSISGSEDRNAWVTTALAHLHLLKRLSCVVNNEVDNAKVAIMADLDCIEKYVGDHIYGGVKASRIRQEEQSRFTRALALYLARNSGEDFVLEIWMCSTYGRSIEEDMSTMTTVEDWERILGQYLYAAMKTSRIRKIEEDAGKSLTSAVRISFPNGDNYDSKLEVKMNFIMGREIWDKAYP